MTVEDLGYKPVAIQKAKIEYSPLCKVFNTRLDESDNKGVLKRLKNIESKNEQQLQAIKSRGQKHSETVKDQKEEQLHAIKDQQGMIIDDKKRVKNKSTFETIAEVNKNKNAKKEAERFEKIDETVNYDKLSIIDKNYREIIGFAKYMDLDAFPRKKFLWQDFTKKGRRNAG